MGRRIVFFMFVSVLLLISLTQRRLLQSSPAYAQEKKPADAAAAQKADDCDTSPIAALNEGIQFRFQEVDNNLQLGMRRALPPRLRYHLHRNQVYPLTFSPNSIQELVAVDQLEQEGWQVGFYLIGRSILGEKPDKSLWDDPKSDYYKRKPINNPLLMTKTTKADELPAAWELWDEAQKVLKSFEASANRNQKEFVVGAWTIAARPIRAGQQACLRCHLGDEKLVFTGRAVMALPDELQEAATSGQPKNSPQESKLKVGDPLGVALYAYKQSPKK